MLISDKVPFFSDDAYLIMTNSTNIKYSLKEYECYLEAIYALTSQMKKIDKRWSPRDVEKMIWSIANAEFSTKKTKKRKIDSD